MKNEIALARISRHLKQILNELASLLYEADNNSPVHFTLKTDTSLLSSTEKLLQKLKSVKPEPSGSRKYSREEAVLYYPAIEEMIIHVSGAITSDDHTQYSRSIEDAFFSAEYYINYLKNDATAPVPRQREALRL